MNTTTPSQTSTDPIEIDLGGSELKVIYEPNISNELKVFIQENIAPSMEAADSTSNQYEPCQIDEFITENADKSLALSDQDIKVVSVLKSHYDYIEF